MPQVPVGLKRRVLQQGGRGLPGGPLLATTTSDNISYLAFSNISPRTPRKCIRANGSRVCCLPESSSSQRWSVDLICSLGLGERWRKVLLAPHTGGPSIPCTHGEKVALRRECYADHTEQVCPIPWEMWAIKVFISEEVKITRPMVPTSLLNFEAPWQSPIARSATWKQ